MVRKYEILDPQIPSDETSDSILKNVTLRVGSKQLDHISKCIERTTDLKTLSNVPDGNVLNECYVDLTLDKLRELDSDTYAQDQYILSRSKFLDKGLINVVVIKLMLNEGETLETGDYEYLNNLLAWRRNDIYLMPLLEYGKSVPRQQRIDGYLSFVDQMIQDRTSWIGDNTPIGMSIPDYIPRPIVEVLFNKYGDCGATFVGLDFNNNRMDKPSDKTGIVVRHFRQCKEEKTFLYGINVKPYKKGADIAAWDIYMSHGSFNAIGPTHTKAHPVSVADSWESMGRIFDKDEVAYPRMNEMHRDLFISWMKDRYDIDLDKDYTKNSRSLYSYLKRYNFEGANKVLGNLSDAIASDDSDYIKMMRDHMPDEMKGIQIIRDNGPKRRSRRCLRKTTLKRSIPSPNNLDTLCSRGLF